MEVKVAFPSFHCLSFFSSSSSSIVFFGFEQAIFRKGAQAFHESKGVEVESLEKFV